MGNSTRAFPGDARQSFQTRSIVQRYFGRGSTSLSSRKCILSEDANEICIRWDGIRQHSEHSFHDNAVLCQRRQVHMSSMHHTHKTHETSVFLDEICSLFQSEVRLDDLETMPKLIFVRVVVFDAECLHRSFQSIAHVHLRQFECIRNATYTST